MNYAASDPYYVGDGNTPDGVGAAIDPMALVARAQGSIEFPAPTPVFGPDATTIAVKIPVWLSTAPFQPVTQVATAGQLTAEVTADLVETVWQMGEPRDPAAPSVTAPPVVCAGSGTPFATGMNPGQPPCGYTYIWRSLPERTAGTGTWPVTVTSHYAVTWTVTGNGAVIESGTDAVETTTTMPLLVREWHSILVDQFPS